MKEKYYSQYGQDQYLDEKIFKRKTNGIFLDIGAYDGVEYSNTYFLEQNRGWKGICIEPNPVVFPGLVKSRNCICKNVCISSKTGTVTYLHVSGYAAMLSGILEFYDNEHLKRIDQEIEKYGGSKQAIQVQSMPLQELLLKENIRQIDYCNIDVEGGELDILKSVDLNEVYIKAFTIENAYGDDKVKKYLEQFGYVLFHKIECDDVYLRLNGFERVQFQFGQFINKVKAVVKRFVKF